MVGIMILNAEMCRGGEGRGRGDVAKLTLSCLAGSGSSSNDLSALQAASCLASLRVRPSPMNSRLPMDTLTYAVRNGPGYLIERMSNFGYTTIYHSMTSKIQSVS